VNEKKGLTFARGLRSILRHDPDKIMVGEIRDQETAQIAINSGADRSLGIHHGPREQRGRRAGTFLEHGCRGVQLCFCVVNCILAQRLVRLICDFLQDGGSLPGPNCWKPAAWIRC